jgi:hypothetical protein
LLLLGFIDRFFHLVHSIEVFLSGKFLNRIIHLLAGICPFTARNGQNGQSNKNQRQMFARFCYPGHGVLLIYSPPFLSST